jgi:hypothetical protein
MVALSSALILALPLVSLHLFSLLCINVVCLFWLCTGTGSYIANRVSNKLDAVHDRIYCCRSGSAADTQAISDIVKYYLDMHGYKSCSLFFSRTL